MNYQKKTWSLGVIAIGLLLPILCLANGNKTNDSSLSLEAENFDEQVGVQAENCQEGGQNIGYIENGDYIKFNQVDFGSGYTYFNARAASNTNGGTIELYLDTQTGSPYTTVKVTNTGGWQSWETITSEIEKISGVHDIYIVFSGESGYLLNLNWLQFTAAPLNMNITLLFPNDGEELTDISCSFKAKIASDGPYKLHLSKTEDFSGEVITHIPVTQNDISKDSRNVVYFLTLQGKLHFNQKFVLTPGDWYWKVSADAGESYSETRKLTVNEAHPVVSPKKLVDSEHPIFHMRLRGRIFDFANPIERLKKIVPDDMKEYVVLDIGTSFSFIPNGRDLFEYCKLFNDAGYKFYFDLGAHSVVGRIASLGEMEKVFRELPNCVGAATGEMNYYYPYTEEDNSLLHGTLQLCQKYGRHFLLADMNWNWAKWQLFSYRFYDLFMSEGYGPYFVPQFKTTDPWGTSTCVSAIQGMKLAGMADNIGIWSDMWCWEKFGQVNTIELTDWMSGSHNPDGGQNAFPFIQNMKAYIWGITFGSTTFGLEPTLWAHWETSEPNELHSRYLMPFIEAVVNENIVPSEEAINNNFNVVVNTQFTSKDFGKSPRLTYMEGNVWGDLLRNTYGISDIEPYNEVVTTNQGDIIQAAYVEMIPNTDRYPSGIPFLAKPSTPAPVVNGEKLEIVGLSQLLTKSNTNEYLNTYYAESENEGFGVKIDSSIFVFNTYENHDITQKYQVGIHHAGIDSLYGEIPLLNYIMGRIRPDGKSLFIQTNAYVKNSNLKGAKYNLPTYKSVLHFKCQSEPVLTSPEISAITKSWDNDNGILTVSVDHTLAGAVNFVLVGDASVSYQVDSVSINTQNITMEPDEQMQLSANLYPSNLKGIAPVWRSLNPNIARVSRNGNIEAVKPGEVQIVAEVNGVSDTLLCTVNNKTAIQKDLMDKVQIYPNPAKDKIFIKGVPYGTTIHVKNLAGKQILSTNENPVHLDGLNSGVYLIQFRRNESTHTKKLLIE